MMKKQLKIKNNAIEEGEVKSVTIDGWDEIDGWNPTITLMDDNQIKILFPDFPGDKLMEKYGEDIIDSASEIFEEKIGNCEIYQEELFWMSGELVSGDITFDKVVNAFLNFWD